MKLQTVRILRCPYCTVTFIPDESESLFTFGACPSCGRKVKPEPFYLVHDTQLKPKPVLVPTKKKAPAKTEGKTYTCSYCGGTGHNARSCEIKKEAEQTKEDEEKVHDAFKFIVNDPEVIEAMEKKIQITKPGSPREYEAVKGWIESKSSYPSAIDAIALNLDLPHNLVVNICNDLNDNIPGFSRKGNTMFCVKEKRP